MVKYSRFTEDPDYDVITYGQALENDSYLTFDKQIIEQAYYEMRSKEKVSERLALQTMIYYTGGKLRFLNTPSIYTYLTAFEGCPEHYFNVRGRTNISLDTKKVLSKLVANNYAPEFLHYYMDYKSYNSKANKLLSVLACDEVVGKNKAGKSLYKLPYNVNVQQNLRFNYKDIDVIGQIPKDYTYAYSAPEGYCLAWGDFAQSDWRIAYNLFIRNPENDKIMNQCDDKYEALARIIAKNSGQEFNLENFKKMRPVYKVNTLATIYGTRSSLIQEDNAFIRMFTKFLMDSPKYVEYVERIKDKVKLGLGVTVTSYFGYEQIISPAYESAMVNKCLNTPVQTCTSEIMIMTVNKILRMFYELGYTKDDIRVFMCRHDEPIFIMKEHVLKDAWIFKEFESIYVDDWTPLKLDFNYGYSYKRPDEELESIAAKSISDNMDKIHFVTAEENLQNDFMPVTATLKLQVKCESVDGLNIVTIFNSNEKLAHNFISRGADISAVVSDIKLEIRKIASKITGYEGITVRWAYGNAKDSYADQFIQYWNDESPSMQDVCALSDYAVLCYCKANGIESPVAEPDAYFNDLIKQTKKWGILNE